MKSIQLTSHVGNDGILSLQLPNDMKNQSFEILVVLQPFKELSANENSWSPRLFEKTYGATADDPIERAPQGEFEIREHF